jgi:hypothetical protein
MVLFDMPVIDDPFAPCSIPDMLLWFMPDMLLFVVLDIDDPCAAWSMPDMLPSVVPDIDDPCAPWSMPLSDIPLCNVP